MKKLLFLSLSALVLTACTPKAYTDDMDAGKNAFQKGNYDEAITNFKNALNEKKTDEAKNDLQLAESMEESTKLYRSGNFDAALYSLNEAVKSSQTDAAFTDKAKVLMNKINKAKTLSDSMKEKMTVGKTFLMDKKYDKAAEVFNEVSSTQNYQEVAPIKNMTEEASKLASESADKKKTADQVQETKKPETVQTPKTEVKPKQEQPATALTHEEAENLVKQHLNIQPNQNVFVKYDHDASNGDYIVHVYEIIVDNPKTGEGHTNTWGWYGVNKSSKVVYDAMK